VDAIGLVHNDPIILTGESWLRGSVVLSWDDVERDEQCVGLLQFLRPNNLNTTRYFERGIKMKTTIKFVTVILSVFAFNCVSAEGMDPASDAMTMHHMHVLINHAMEMAAGGSNLVMLGQMDMAHGVDNMTVHHGQMMIDDAKSLIKEIMSSKEMAALHKKGETTEMSPEMAYTHKMAKAAQDYIDVISAMPAMPEDDMNMEHMDHMDMHH
jgi:hypothetical protein